MNNGLVTGLRFGIGVGIGIMVVKEAKCAYDRYMLKRKIMDLWSEIKKGWNDAAEKAN